jgi:hypothetical protein
MIKKDGGSIMLIYDTTFRKNRNLTQRVLFGDLVAGENTKHEL